MATGCVILMICCTVIFHGQRVFFGTFSDELVQDASMSADLTDTIDLRGFSQLSIVVSVLNNVRRIGNIIILSLLHHRQRQITLVTLIGWHDPVVIRLGADKTVQNLLIVVTARRHILKLL